MLAVLEHPPPPVTVFRGKSQTPVAQPVAVAVGLGGKCPEADGEATSFQKPVCLHSHEALFQQSLPGLLVGASGLAGLGTRVGLVVGTFGLVALSRMRGSQMVLFGGWILDLQVGRQDQGTRSFRNQ